MRHYHRDSEEIYYLVEGAGEMELDGERRGRGGRRRDPDPARAPGTRSAPTTTGPLRLLCACAPPYRHEDTFFS